MRQINLHIDLDAMREVVDLDQLSKTLGYLCTWGSSPTRVEIYPETRSETDFVAVFYRDDDTMVIAIGAVWRADENRYTTHS